MKSLILLIMVFVGLVEVGLGLTHAVGPYSTGSDSQSPQRPLPPIAPPVRVVAQTLPPTERLVVQDIPVPIYPESRTTEARIETPIQPQASQSVVASTIRRRRNGLAEEGQPAPLSMVESHMVTGQISATESRAYEDAKKQLRYQVAEWLAPEVPASWRPPAHLIDQLIMGKDLRTIEKDYGTLYQATLRIDTAPARRAELLTTYREDMVTHRMVLLGGLLGAVLACLAAIAGYIRADEATKGYYTNWLRLAAAAGVGASGVVIYQLIA